MGYLAILRLSLQSGNETNNPLKSGPALAGPAGPATPPQITCASRQVGRAIRPPLTPIPVVGPFDQVGVDVIQIIKSYEGNQYGIVFVDYQTKWRFSVLGAVYTETRKTPRHAIQL